MIFAKLTFHASHDGHDIYQCAELNGHCLNSLEEIDSQRNR